MARNGRNVAGLPSPMAPSSRVPQAHTLPSLRSATACFRPASIWMMLVRPETRTGEMDGFG